MGGYPTEVKTDLHSIPHANTPRSERIMGRDAGSVISEGVRLSNDFWNYFWDSDKQHYVSKRQTSETVCIYKKKALYTSIPYESSTDNIN